MIWRIFSLGVVAAVMALAITWADRVPTSDFVVYSATQPGIAIVLPVDALPEETRAAALLQTTFAQAASRSATNFPVVSIAARRTAGPAIFVGATELAPQFLRHPPGPPFDTGVGLLVRNGHAVLRSERRESIEIAASWFLERTLHAHWFMPGPLGESIPVTAELALPAGETVARPGFVSRDLGGISGAEGHEWLVRNRLERRFEYGHSYGAIFRPADLEQIPAMAPLRDGRKHFPKSGEQNWQPDLTSAAAIDHAAAVINRAFDLDPRRRSFSLSENDSPHFDESAATLAAVAPPRFFRGRPDYSDLVFGFTNAVADRVRVRHPDRWLPAYAYLWAENAPRFHVSSNVLPILTADRSQWFDPRFAAEDRQLIARWTHAGAGMTGAYDYFYGAPFLVPRPTLYAVSDSIPFEYRSGIRMFYAETSPNWGLDGPKPWLAAQLLWAPQSKPEALLDLYYREFWGEVAGPIREFFERCDDAWRKQPAPGYWLKYYRDEQQVRLFPPAVRQALRDRLSAAERRANHADIHARVAQLSAAFSVTEAFAQYAEARDELGKLAESAGDPARLIAAWAAWRDRRRDFIMRHAAVRREFPLAIATDDLAIYLRNDPSSRVARALVATAAGRLLLAEHASLPWLSSGVTAAEVAELLASDRKVLADPAWAGVEVGSVDRSIDFTWTRPATPWQGRGEPAEGRAVGFVSQPGVAGKVLRFSHCHLDTMSQWAQAAPDMRYAAQVQVRAKVSPGNYTYLVVSFLDAEQRHIGIGRIDRLPADDHVQTAHLCLIGRTPPNTRYIGIGVCTANEVGDDFAEFDAPTLRLGGP